MIEGFLLGLSIGVFCLGWCLPAFLPFLLSEERKIKESFTILGRFLGGRFFAYLIFGALIGYLGEKLQTPILFKISYAALAILGILLVFYGLAALSGEPRLIGRGKFKRVLKICQIFPKIKTPWLLGFLLGLNICPPFIGAVLYTFSLKSIFLSVLFFIAFFLGTSIYLVLPVFLGVFSSAKVLQKIAQVSCILAGFWFLTFSLQNLFFFKGFLFCPFENFHFPFLKYPIEILLLVLAVSLGIFAFVKRRYFYLRYLTLTLFFLSALFKFPQFCPFLTLQEVSLGRFSNIFSLLFFLLILVSALVVGRFFCGWTCPGLFFQEIIFKISEKFKKPLEIKFPPKLTYLKFLILILILVLVWAHKDIILCGKDPFGALFGFFRNSVSLTLLIFLFFFSIFIFLPFCKYFCPLGAILSLLSKISIFRLKIEGQAYCRMGAISDNKIDNSECLRCGDCLASCKKDAIKFKI